MSEPWAVEPASPVERAGVRNTGSRPDVLQHQVLQRMLHCCFMLPRFRIAVSRWF
jgi:hypothetical protein